MNLTVTANEIREHHAHARRAFAETMEHALEAGRLLTLAKAGMAHGTFGAWVEQHCGFSDRTARRYMQLHSHREALPDGAGVRGALEHLREPRPKSDEAKTDTVSDLPQLGDYAAHLQHAKDLDTRGSAISAELAVLGHQLPNASKPEDVARIAKRAGELAKQAVDIQVRAQRGLGQLLADVPGNAPAWLPPIGEAAAVSKGERIWIIWRWDTDPHFVHAMFLDMCEVAPHSIITKKPIRQDWIDGQLKMMEMIEPNCAAWSPFPLERAHELREMAKAA